MTTTAARDVVARLDAMGVQRGRLTVDSRSVSKGDVFVALAGARLDGRQFMGDALARGASAVLRDRDSTLEPSDDSRVLDVVGLSAALGDIADEFYSQPSSTVDVFGVTGTNGKTSIVNWIAQALTLLGTRCGAMGTLGISLDDRTWDTNNTTPDAATVHTFLRELQRAGAGAVAMEVSSHALQLHRVTGVRFDTVVFTNLTQDHLDFHGTMASYGAAKAKLFTDYPARHRIVNADDAFGATLLERGLSNVVSYGMQQGDLRGSVARMTATGMHLTIACAGDVADLKTNLIGKFNAYNLLAVAAVLHSRGLPLAQIASTLSQLRAAPGRMQRVGGGVSNAPSIYVDYAHTPDALTKALETLRETRPVELSVVFGCGGDRDRSKRPVMGRIAASGADRIYVTSDNPRTEAPDVIIGEVVDGIPEAQRGVTHVQPDRRQAIRSAVADAVAGSAVLIAGKGHETYQETAGVRAPFSDVEEARVALEAWSSGISQGVADGRAHVER